MIYSSFVTVVWWNCNLFFVLKELFKMCLKDYSMILEVAQVTK